jgi:hypothetical protein
MLYTFIGWKIKSVGCTKNSCWAHIFSYVHGGLYLIRFEHSVVTYYIILLSLLSKLWWCPKHAVTNSEKWVANELQNIGTGPELFALHEVMFCNVPRYILPLVILYSYILA